MAESNYANIERPYDNQLLRNEYDLQANNVPDVSQTESGRTVKAGQSFNNLWIDTWIKSDNYLPKKQGFFLDAKQGLIEGEWLQVSTGIEMYGNDAYFYDFSSGGKGILTANVTNGGSGYSVGNILTVVQDNAEDGRLRVTSAPGGVVATVVVDASGAGYSLASGLATTGGAGTGCTVRITALTATGNYAGNTTTLHFQRKFYPDQDFIIQRRIGKDSASDALADNVFEMYYPNPEQTGRRNYIFIGTSGNISSLSDEHTDVMRMYANQGFQLGTSARYTNVVNEINVLTSDFPGVTSMNPNGSRIIISYKTTDPEELYDPASWGTFKGSFVSFGSVYAGLPVGAIDLFFIADNGGVWIDRNTIPQQDGVWSLGTLDWPVGSNTPYRWKKICLTTGTIDGTGGYFNFDSYDFPISTYRNVQFNLGGVATLFVYGAGIAPLTMGGGTCGRPLQYWSTVYTNSVTIGGTTYTPTTITYLTSLTGSTETKTVLAA
jgi:hypothetical protein